MQYASRRARAGAVAVLGATAALLSLAPAAGANTVPVSGTLVAHTVGPNAAKPGARRIDMPLRVRNPARYAAEKAAANNAYARWAASSPFASPFVESPTSSVGINKLGLSANSSPSNQVTPPDTTGAAGPSNFLEFVNSEIAVYSRTGVVQGTATEDTFTGSTSTCDGQIKWDAAAKRFIYYSLDCGAATGAEGFSIGFSKTASPLPLPTTTSAGNWCRYHVPTGSNLEDYGKLGNNNTMMIVGANEFNDSTFNYLDSPIIEFPTPSATATTCPTSLAGKIFRPSPVVAFTPEPANLASSSALGYIVGVNTSTTLRMYTLGGTPTAPVLTDKGNITVPAYAQPANVPQPAPAPASDVIDSSDTRLTQANGIVDPTTKTFGIWTQHTIAGPNGGPSVVRWYELQAGKTTPVQLGTIAVTGQFAFNGAISATTGGKAAAIDYNVGSRTLLVQQRARFHAATAAPGTMAGEVILSKSSAVDNDFSCPSATGGTRPCRWGDYAGAVFDPASATTVWGANQDNGPLVPGNGPQWRTRFFTLIP